MTRGTVKLSYYRPGKDTVSNAVNVPVGQPGICSAIDEARKMLLEGLAEDFVFRLALEQ